MPILLLTLMALILLGMVVQFFLARKTFRMTRKLATMRESDQDSRQETLSALGAIEYRMKHPTVDFEPSASGDVAWIICITLNRRAWLARTLHTLKLHDPDLKILVIDNGSEDGTPSFLLECLSQGLVDKLLLNRPGDVPQWMKSFNLHQGFKLLSPERVDFLGWIDDDMEIIAPWKHLGMAILKQLKTEGVRMVGLCRDKIQDANHPTLEVVEIDGQEVAIKATINGAFIFFEADFLKQFGLPPIREGVNDLGMEDWYYSRLLQGQSLCCAAVNRSIHHGYLDSLRESLTAASTGAV